MPGWHAIPRPSDDELLVSEIFGPTVQGEGPSAGIAATFVRLGACNLSCKWCDTPYTWDARAFDLTKELETWSIADVIEAVRARPTELVVITGGEPLLQQAQVSRLLDELHVVGRRVEFETNGTRSPNAIVAADRLVVSPKLANSGLPVRARLKWPVLTEYAALPQACFKFVVEGLDDLDEVESITARLRLPAGRIWIMPQATEPQPLRARLEHLAPAVASHGWSLSTRLQVLIWGNERGH